jgi:hypothetical protein
MWALTNTKHLWRTIMLIKDLPHLLDSKAMHTVRGGESSNFAPAATERDLTADDKSTKKKGTGNPLEYINLTLNDVVITSV